MHLLVSTHNTPIVVVEIDSSCGVNRIHATHFWETLLSTLADFIECGNGFDLRMGPSPLLGVELHTNPFQVQVAGEEGRNVVIITSNT
jgi:hypothetical protein